MVMFAVVWVGVVGSVGGVVLAVLGCGLVGVLLWCVVGGVWWGVCAALVVL